MAISQGGQGRGSLFTEINITPLTDIFLVLLIIMMVIAPTFQDTRKDIKAPAIKSGKAIEDNKVTVEVVKNGGIYLNGQQTAVTGLAQALKPLTANLTEKHLIVRADAGTESSVVMKVFDAASEAGYTKLTIAGESLSESRSQELQQSAPSSSAAQGGM